MKPEVDWGRGKSTAGTAEIMCLDWIAKQVQTRIAGKVGNTGAAARHIAFVVGVAMIVDAKLLPLAE